MSHIHHLRRRRHREARAIIHLGATSAYVTDNTDIIQMREALGWSARRIVIWWPSWPTSPASGARCRRSAFTHFQPAQPTTVGKRATLWLQDCCSTCGRSSSALDDAAASSA